MADATYQPKVYRTQGGAELVITTSGTLTLEGRVDLTNGSSMTFASGSGVVLQSGSSFSAATALEVASGGSIQMASGSYLSVPYQTLTSTQTGTDVIASGVSLLTGTTTGPRYSMVAPSIAGQLKEIVLAPSSSGATHRAVVYFGSTGGTFTHHSGSGNQVTLATSAHQYIRLVSTSATNWRVMATVANLDPTFSNKTT